VARSAAGGPTGIREEGTRVSAAAAIGFVADPVQGGSKEPEASPAPAHVLFNAKKFVFVE
jgi:hypothetical protein